MYVCIRIHYPFYKVFNYHQSKSNTLIPTDKIKKNKKT